MAVEQVAAGMAISHGAGGIGQRAAGRWQQASGSGHWTLDSGQLAADRAQRAAGSRQWTVRVGLSGDSSKQSWLFRLFVTAVFGSIAFFTCEVDEQTLNIAVYLPFTRLTNGVGLPMRCSVLQSKDGTNKNSHRSLQRLLLLLIILLLLFLQSSKTNQTNVFIFEMIKEKPNHVFGLPTR